MTESADQYKIQNEYMRAYVACDAAWLALSENRISQEDFCRACRRLALAAAACEVEFRNGDERCTESE
jgi:hypothetical protein